MKPKGNALAQTDPVATEKDMEMMDNNHLDTLMKAHEIMMNPEHMKRVHALAGRKHKAIKSIADIKNALNEKYGPKGAKPTDPEGETKMHEKSETPSFEKKE